MTDSHNHIQITPETTFSAADMEAFLVDAHVATAEQIQMDRIEQSIGSAAVQCVAERQKRHEGFVDLSNQMRYVEQNAANLINADSSPHNVACKIAESYGVFLNYYKTIKPDSAEYEATRRARAIPFRLIGNHLAMNIIDSLSDIMQSSSLIDELDLGAFMEPHATLSGGRGRVHYGDEARLGAALYMLLLPALEKAMVELPATVYGAASYMTKKQSAAAAHQLRKDSLSLSASESPYKIEKDGEQHRTHRQRFLEFQAFHLPTDPTEMMKNFALPSQIEALISALGDLYRAYDIAGTPREVQLQTSIGALDSFRRLAYLRNEVGGTIGYKDRYVWQSSVGGGRKKSKRTSLFSVRQDAQGTWTATATRSPLNSPQLANRPGRCPGKDAVLPNDHQVNRHSMFFRHIEAIAGYDKIPPHLYEGIAEPDVISTFCFVAIERLRDAGVISLTQSEFERHLGPDQNSDGVTFKKDR